MSYNKAYNRLFAATGWGIDCWDTSTPDGKEKLLVSEPAGSNGSRSSSSSNSIMDSSSFTTRIVADPSGRIMVISDRAGNSLRIMDVQDDDAPQGLGTVARSESCGPRRRAFYAADGRTPSRYFVLCQSTI